jgi:hypothetical protein
MDVTNKGGWVGHGPLGRPRPRQRTEAFVYRKLTCVALVKGAFKSFRPLKRGRGRPSGPCPTQRAGGHAISLARLYTAVVLSDKLPTMNLPAQPAVSLIAISVRRLTAGMSRRVI